MGDETVPAAIVIFFVIVFIIGAIYKNCIADPVSDFNTYCMDAATDGNKRMLVCDIKDGPPLTFSVEKERKCITIYKKYSCRGFLISEGKFVNLRVESEK